MTSEPSILSPKILSLDSQAVLLGGKSLKDYPSLVGYLENFDAGRQPTPATNFYSNLGLGRQGVLERTESLVHTWNDIPRLQEYELTRTAKYGEQGYIYPLSSDYQIGMFEGYYSQCHNPCSVPESVMRAWFDAMAGPLLVPYTPEQVIARQLEHNGLKSNAGIMHKIAFVKREGVITQAIIEADAIRSEADVLTYASVVGARCIKQKERLIFMMPMCLNIVELQYVYALMDAMLERLNCVAGWQGQPATEVAVNEHMIEDGATYLSTDYSHMDMNVGPAQHKVYLDAVLPLFEPKYRARYRRIVTAKAEMPVVIGAVKIPGQAPTSVGAGTRKSYRLVTLTGTHGKTSGEGDTNCEETVLGILNKLELSARPKVSSIGFQQLGDDGFQALSVPASVDVALEFSRSAHSMGFIANADKQLVSSTTGRYLQRTYDIVETEYHGFVQAAYPCVLMVNSLKNPERETALTPLQQAVRTIEIAENCNHHPKWFEIAGFVVEGSPVLQEYVGTPLIGSPLEREWNQWIGSTGEVASHGLAERGLQSYSFVHLLQEMDSVRTSNSRTSVGVSGRRMY